jgi:hypothetical protein
VEKEAAPIKLTASDDVDVDMEIDREVPERTRPAQWVYRAQKKRPRAIGALL